MREPSSPPEPPEPSPRVSWWRGILTLLIAAGAVALTLRLAGRLDWTDLAARLASAERQPVLAATLLLAARFAALHWRLQGSLARLDHRVRGLPLFFLVAASALLNHVTPSARLLGGVFRARHLSRRLGRSFASMYGAVLFDQVAHQVVLGLVTWLCLIALGWHLELAWLAISAGAALLALLAVFGLRRGRRRDEASRLVDWLERYAERQGRLGSLASGSRRAVRSFRRLLAETSLRPRLAAGGLAFFIFSVVAQLLVFRALGVTIDPWVAAVTIGLGAAAGALTGTPGGFGTTEAAMIGCYVALGVERVDAVAGTMLFRGLHYVLVLVLGLPALLAFELRGPAARQGARPASGLRDRDPSAREGVEGALGSGGGSPPGPAA